MNAKSKLMVKYADGVIEMNTTFAKMMQNPLSDEYALLQRTRQDFPSFAVRRRQIKSNPKKDTYKGLTYEYMKMYIRTHESEKNVQEVLDYLDEQILISKCHGQRLRYPTIKKWFLAKYPEVAKFGTIENSTEAQAEVETPVEENKSQSVIPMHTTTQNDELDMVS